MRFATVVEGFLYTSNWAEPWIVVAQHDQGRQLQCFSHAITAKLRSWSIVLNLLFCTNFLAPFRDVVIWANFETMVLNNHEELEVQTEWFTSRY